MDRKHYLVAILTAAILSISFLSCDPKDDDPTTNPTPSTDVVKEVYGFFGKPEAQVLSILDAKGWTKVSDSAELGLVYSYISADSLKVYAVYSIDNTIKGAAYSESESPITSYGKNASNTNKFISLFEIMEQSLSTISLLNINYIGKIIADNGTFNQEYYDRAEFLSDFQAKKSTLYLARSSFYGEEMSANTHLYLNDEDNESEVFVVFEDNLVIEKLGKTTKDSWFKR
ncbi:MAG: hypothetical protein H6Q16_1152 [Bacteroidetes bacterium]|nr:hypothetical protein [Bacteroidota bacterium]